MIEANYLKKQYYDYSLNTMPQLWGRETGDEKVVKMAIKTANNHQRVINLKCNTQWHFEGYYLSFVISIKKNNYTLSKSECFNRKCVILKHLRIRLLPPNTLYTLR